MSKLASRHYALLYPNSLSPFADYCIGPVLIPARSGYELIVSSALTSKDSGNRGNPSISVIPMAFDVIAGPYFEVRAEMDLTVGITGYGFTEYNNGQECPIKVGND